MLTTEEAFSLLRDGERRQWLIADWSWYRDNDSHGSVYIGFVRSEKTKEYLNEASWDVSKGDSLTGFTVWWENGVEKTEYNYAPVSNDSWPLVIHRDFHGIKEPQSELIEEFRHYHNLWHDQLDDYYKIKDDGELQKVVFRDERGALLIDTATLRQFCAARGLSIILQVDAVQFLDQEVSESSQQFNEDNLIAIKYTSKLGGLSGERAFTRMLGKRIINPLPKNRCGIWPYEAEKSYESYILGVNEDGTDATYTSNPELLNDYFGKNPGHPHYLTYIYFRKDVLKKYLEKPSIFSIEDGYLQCGGLWGVRIDNDHEDYIVVFLGDLGRDLPENEQLYWRSFNIRPQGGLSESHFKRSFLGQFADPINPELLIKPAYDKLLKSWFKTFGFSLYSPFHEGDKGIMADLRLPISNEWTEFDKCTIATTKIFVDYLNEADLAKGATEAIKKLQTNNPDRPIRGIDKLSAWIETHGGNEHVQESINHLRLAQSIRSISSAHRKNSSLNELLKRHKMDSASPRDIYKKLILIPLLSYCQILAEFAESQNPSENKPKS